MVIGGPVYGVYSVSGCWLKKASIVVDLIKPDSCVRSHGCGGYVDDMAFALRS